MRLTCQTCTLFPWTVYSVLTSPNVIMGVVTDQLKASLNEIQQLRQIISLAFSYMSLKG